MMGLAPGATVAFVMAGTFVIVANLITYAILGQVNAKLPQHERLSYTGFHLGKNRRISRLYRHFYPEGRLLWVSRGCFIMALGCMLLVAMLDR
jgi:hypothetical protein